MMEKYSYIGCLRDFEMCKARAFQGLRKGETGGSSFILATIFDIDLRELPSRRFGENIKKRIETELKTIEDVMPGTFHYDAEITDLFYQTECLCHYEYINDKVVSFIEMFNKAEELFFKSLHTELEEDEIKEYNIIVSSLNLVDRLIPSKKIYYSYVRCFRDIYSELGFTKLSSYARQRSSSTFEPWACIEFLENTELVQQFVNVIPEAKQRMRNFAQKVQKLYCSFVWSDAPYIEPDEEERDMGEEGYYQRTNIYIPKTDKELGEDAKYVELLINYTKSHNLGGLTVPDIEVIKPEDVNYIDYIRAMKGIRNA